LLHRARADQHSRTLSLAYAGGHIGQAFPKDMSVQDMSVQDMSVQDMSVQDMSVQDMSTQ